MNPSIVLPEPEGIPAVKIALDQPGCFVICAGDPDEVHDRIVAWLDQEQYTSSRGLAFTDVKFGGEFYLTAYALQRVTSVERTYLIDSSARVPRGLHKL